MAQTQRVTGRATTVYTDDSGALCCIYHQTTVARKHKDGRIELNTGGWRTVTTKTRMNQFANQFCERAYSVFQKDHAWFVQVGAKVLPFDGQRITITP